MFDGSCLAIEIQDDKNVFARITFKDVIGFRVLDERDLCEFWNRYSEPNGWLYEVHSGGWVELEKHREFFSTPDFFESDLKEFFIADNHCISILCVSVPLIEDVDDNANEWNGV